MRTQYDLMTDQGKSLVSIIDYFKGQGHPISRKDIDIHKKHLAKESERKQTVEITPGSTQIVLKDIGYVSKRGISLDEVQQRLLYTALEAVDLVADDYKTTGDIRVLPRLIDLIRLSNTLVESRRHREEDGVAPDVSVTIKIGSLEESLEESLD